MSLFVELKRRNVFRVAIAYIITAWLVLQVADIVLNNIGAAGWVFPAILLILVLGFPLAILLAWAFELTPEGLKREKEVERSQSVTHQTGRKLDRVIIVVLAIAVSYFAWDRFGTDQGVEQQPFTAEKASIAVLPFVNMSSDPEQEYFSDGISEELLNLLAKIPQFEVAGRTSSFAFKEKNDDLRTIGSKLGVKNILEGSVRKGDDRVRITAQLVKVDDGFHLWSESYDRQLNDVLAVQDEIAAAVVDELKITLLGVEIPAAGQDPLYADVDAHNSYLQGLFFMNKVGPDNSAKAARHFRDAVERVPGSALAWAAFGGAQIRYAGQADRDSAEALAEGRTALAKAFSLDDQLPEAYLVLADLALYFDWDWPAAETAARRALELRPGDVAAAGINGWLAFILGRTEEALSRYREVVKRDPLNSTARFRLVAQLANAGHLDEAETLLRRRLEQDPGANFTNGYLSWILSLAGRYKEALAFARDEPVDFVRLQGVAIVEHQLGNQAAAKRAQQQLLAQYGDLAAYQQASIHAEWGDPDRTMEWLERAYQARDPGMTTIKTDQEFRFLHDDRRFIALLEKMNLVD